jgi:D-hydroxyproline dehydrogenase subunit beta
LASSTTDGSYDDVVVGAGIVGLAHAYHLGRRGRRVLVIERHSRPQGASVRNFGMLWPIGQPAGDLRLLALYSRTMWLDVLTEAGIWHDKSGSLHVAYADDEARVLAEFADEACRGGFPCKLLDPPAALKLCPRLKPDGLQLALWSPNETCVDPRATLAQLPRWLERNLNVSFTFDTLVTGCRPQRVAAGVRRWETEQVWVCSGDELQTLFGAELQRLGLIRCKLQMMRSEPVAWRLGPILAAALALPSHKSFANCAGLPALTSRLEAEFPNHMRSGIRVMVSQDGPGELVIGDSHEYGAAIEPFDKPSIEALTLEYLNRFLDVPELRLKYRWHGLYVKHPSDPYVILNPEDGVTVVTALGGHGLTMSFGVAERVVQQTLG